MLKSIWEQTFPPYSIWLYGRLKRSRTVIISPADAWRMLEKDIQNIPVPSGILQKILYWIVLVTLEKSMAEWLKLDNMGVTLTGTLDIGGEIHPDYESK